LGNLLLSKTSLPILDQDVLGKNVSISGWAQVSGWRGDTPIAKRVEHDIFYLENGSFWLDLKIFWLTLFGRNTNKNAY